MEAGEDTFEVLLYDPKSPKKRIDTRTEIKPAATVTAQVPSTPTGDVKGGSKPPKDLSTPPSTPATKPVVPKGAGAAGETAFLPSLEDYLRRFQATYGICTSLEAPPDLAGRALEPMVGTQLLRIIQETLTNVRKHARARSVRIGLSVADGKAEAVVQDDGDGFDPARLEAAEASTFGLRFMRERAEEVGGSVEVRSVPGEGTRVLITMPLQGRAT